MRGTKISYLLIMFNLYTNFYGNMLWTKKEYYILHSPFSLILIISHYPPCPIIALPRCRLLRFTEELFRIFKKSNSCRCTICSRNSVNHKSNQMHNPDKDDKNHSPITELREATIHTPQSRCLAEYWKSCINITLEFNF